MMNTLYVHIGQPKTGTTTIQKFCATNRTYLLRENIDYIFLTPHSDDVGNACYFSGGLHPLGNISTKDVYVNKILKSLESNNVLLSRETFWFAENLGEWLKQWNDIGVSVKVIVYLRRQDLFFESFWSELIREGKGFSISFDEFVNIVMNEELLPHRCHRYKTEPIKGYLKCLDRIANSIGKENIILRPFEKTQFQGKDLIQDFLNCLCISDYTGAEFVSSENERLCGNVLDYAYWVNKGLSGINDKYFNESAFRSVINEMNENQLLSDPNMAKEGYFEFNERIELLKKFEEENYIIAKKFLDRENGKLFYDEVKNKPIHKGLNNKELEVVLRISGALATCVYNTTEEKQRQNNISFYKRVKTKIKKTINQIGGDTKLIICERYCFITGVKVVWIC